MSKVIMMVGLPGSGKTTFAKNVLMKKDNYIYLSSDDLRVELFGFEYQTRNDELFKELGRRLKAAIVNKQNVIYDATNINRKRRMGLIRNIKQLDPNGEVEAYCLCIPYEFILNRNLVREERHIPEDKLEQMYRGFNVPIMSEGFSDITLLTVTDTITANVFKGFVAETQEGRLHLDLLPYYNELKDYDQKSIYHDFTLDKHIENVFNRTCEIKNVNGALCLAAALHDIGKPDCCTVKEDGIHHGFAGHENVSGYKAAMLLGRCDILSKETKDLVLTIINLHMMIKNSEISDDTLLEYCGSEEYLNYLKMFNNCDQN